MVGLDVSSSSNAPKNIEIHGTVEGCLRFQVEIPYWNFVSVVERTTTSRESWSVSAENSKGIECGRDIRVVVQCLDKEFPDCSVSVTKVIECEHGCPEIPIGLLVLDEKGQKVELDTTDCLESQQYEIQIASPPHDPSYIYSWAIKPFEQYLGSGPNNRSITCILDNELISISLAIVTAIGKEICVYTEVITLNPCLSQTGIPDCKDSSEVTIAVYRPDSGVLIKEAELGCLGPGQYQFKANVDSQYSDSANSYHWYVNNQEMGSSQELIHEFEAKGPDNIYVEVHIEASQSDVCKVRDSITLSPCSSIPMCPDIIVDIEVYDMDQVLIPPEIWNCLPAGDYSLHAILEPDDPSDSYSYRWVIENQEMGDQITLSYNFEAIESIGGYLEVIRQGLDGTLCRCLKVITLAPCSEFPDCSEDYSIDLQVLLVLPDKTIIVTDFDALGEGTYMFNANHEFDESGLTYRWYVNDDRQEGIDGPHFNYPFDALSKVSISVEILLINPGDRCRLRESVFLTPYLGPPICDEIINGIQIQRRQNGGLVEVDNSSCLSRGTYYFTVVRSESNINDRYIWTVNNDETPMSNTNTFVYHYEGVEITTIHLEVQHLTNTGSYCIAKDSISLQPCIEIPLCTDSSIELHVYDESGILITQPSTKCFETGDYTLKAIVRSPHSYTHEYI